MEKNKIKNFERLATTENREAALLIAEAALAALDTERSLANTLKINGEILSVGDESFDLTKFKNIKVVGFGKASCAAAAALEKILGSKIKEGAVIGLETATLPHIETFAGTHPKPSAQNVLAGRKIYELVKNSSAEDLIIVLVSGGGSALLCSSEEESEQGIRLYEAFLKTGKTIGELNTVRKHLSILKGGGLAKIAYPATMIGLIFSDIPGDNYADVASGPTYKDTTTVEDAERIIKENNLGDFELIRTPKDEKYFERVHNFVIVSNKTATEAMAARAKSLGFDADIISTSLYDEMPVVLDKLCNAARSNTAIIAAGEPGLKVPKKIGRGGRNLHMALNALHLKKIGADSVLVSLASDGLDNSDAAGAIVDHKSREIALKLELDSGKYLKAFDSYTFFQAVGDMIETGPTGANVSDLFLLLTKKS